MKTETKFLLQLVNLLNEFNSRIIYSTQEIHIINNKNEIVISADELTAESIIEYINGAE